MIGRVREGVTVLCASTSCAAAVSIWPSCNFLSAQAASVLVRHLHCSVAEHSEDAHTAPTAAQQASLLSRCISVGVIQPLCEATAGGVESNSHTPKLPKHVASPSAAATATSHGHQLQINHSSMVCPPTPGSHLTVQRVRTAWHVRVSPAADYACSSHTRIEVSCWLFICCETDWLIFQSC